MALKGLTNFKVSASSVWPGSCLVEHVSARIMPPIEFSNRIQSLSISTENHLRLTPENSMVHVKGKRVTFLCLN